MKTIAILSQKGGAGKTTISVNLAVAAAVAGQKTCLIDLDPQASATRWSDNRDADNAPNVISAHAIRLPEVLHAAEQDGVTLAFLDTPPSKDPSLVDVAQKADLALIPCRPSGLDLDAIRSTIQVAQIANVPMRVLFNAVKARCSLIQSAKRAVAGFQVEPLPCVLGDRVAFSHSILDGLAAIEYEPTGKASWEVQRLYQQIEKVMEVDSGR